MLAWRQKLGQSLDDARPLIPGIPDCLAQLRSEKFYDSESYFIARRSIDKVLALSVQCMTRICVIKWTASSLPPATKSIGSMNCCRRLMTGENLFGRFYPSVVLPEILVEKPDLVGISILNFQQVIPGLTLAKQLKSKGLRVVIGGTVYTKFVESLRAAPEFFNLCDAVVVYEGVPPSLH